MKAINKNFRWKHTLFGNEMENTVERERERARKQKVIGTGSASFIKQKLARIRCIGPTIHTDTLADNGKFIERISTDSSL